MKLPHACITPSNIIMPLTRRRAQAFQGQHLPVIPSVDGYHTPSCTTFSSISRCSTPTSVPRSAPSPVSRSLCRASFCVPDYRGVFKFVLDYRWRCWMSLQASMTVPVVPPRHDGYPRFLRAVWPYRTNLITGVGFFIFSALWLAGIEGEQEG